MANYRRSIHDLIYGRQTNRILRLAFPNNDTPTSQFLVNKLDAVEGLSKDFEFTVELLSDDAGIALKEMQGKLLSIELVRQNGSLRYFSGYVFSFRRRHADGGITFYEAKLGPWLKFLSLRHDNYLFHGQTLREQMESICRDYGIYPAWDWRVTADDPVMTDACQFDESDFNYLSRRWEAAGWYYWYEHDARGHKLVVASDSTQAPAIDGGADVRFHGAGGAAEEDAIDQWSPARQAVPSSFALAGFNFKDARPSNVDVPTLNQQGNVPDIESYEYTGAYGIRNRSDGNAQSRLRMEEIEAIAKSVDAEGNNRFLMPGRWFQLLDHFNHGIYRHASTRSKDEFLILSVRHVATNNYLQEEDQKIQYRNWLTCSRRDIPWRPGRGFNSRDTRILAPQTATVVGPNGPDSIYTDEYGRVRVQFHWDRVGEQDERSSAWLRVSSAWAGAELGAAAIPRIGTEVIVQWLDGCPDRPIITGAVFNARNMPPWAMPSQHALTGLRSRELAPGAGNSAGGRSNHLILDDTYQRIQAQLRSDHQHSQLSLGYITRIENNRGRTEARGEGFELRTDGHGVVRAASGMLITTEERANALSHVNDMGETVKRLSTAADLQEQLTEMAQHYGAQEKQEPQQADAVNELKSQNHDIQGHGNTEFPELSKPHVVVASPAGVEMSAAQSTHIASGHHTAITSGKSLSIASVDSLFASVGQTFRLFVHKAGMKLIAAGGKVSVQAQENDVEIIANKVLTLLSESDWVTIRGKKGVRLQGANHMLEISDQTQFFTSSPVLFHGNLETLPSKSVSQAFNEKPTGYNFDQEVNFLQMDGKPAPEISYELIRSGHTAMTGKTTASGTTGIQKSAGMESYKIRWKGELP